MKIIVIHPHAIKAHSPLTPAGDRGMGMGMWVSRHQMHNNQRLIEMNSIGLSSLEGLWRQQVRLSP